MRTRPSYRIEDLLEAYFETLRDPPYGIDAFRPFYAHVLAAFCRCFGVSFADRDVPTEKRAALGLLKRALQQEAELPYPGKGALEASLVYAACPEEFRSFFARLRELAAFYRGVARDLASEVWGELGERTDAQLVAAGLDRSREPAIDFNKI